MCGACELWFTEVSILWDVGPSHTGSFPGDEGLGDYRPFVSH